MAQTTKGLRLDKVGGSLWEQYDFDESVTLSTSYTNALDIDSRLVRSSIITFNNPSGTDTDYKIFGTAKKNPDTSNMDSDEWINLISVIDGATGTTYDHTASRPLDAGKRIYVTFGNPYKRVVVQMKADSGTPTVKLWHRGEN